MPFHKELSIDLRSMLKVNVKCLGRDLSAEQDIAYARLQRLPLLPRCAGQEWHSTDVASKPNARGDDNVTHRSAAA